jgi:hypothetical protein
MQQIILKLFGISLAAIFVSYASLRVGGIYDWYVWSSSGYEPYSIQGKFINVRYSGGRNSCNCTVLALKSDELIYHFHTDMSKKLREYFNANRSVYDVTYYPRGNGEFLPSRIVNNETGKVLYEREIYNGYGTTLTSLVFTLILFVAAAFLIMVVLGIIKTDKKST